MSDTDGTADGRAADGGLDAWDGVVPLSEEQEADARAGDDGADAQEPPLRVVVPAAGLVFEAPDGRPLLSLVFGDSTACLCLQAPDGAANVQLYVYAGGAMVRASAGGPPAAYLHGFADAGYVFVTDAAGEVNGSLCPDPVGPNADSPPPREGDPAEQAEQADLAALLVLTAGTVLH